MIYPACPSDHETVSVGRGLPADHRARPARRRAASTDFAVRNACRSSDCMASNCFRIEFGLQPLRATTALPAALVGPVANSQGLVRYIASRCRARRSGVQVDVVVVVVMAHLSFWSWKSGAWSRACSSSCVTASPRHRGLRQHLTLTTAGRHQHQHQHEVGVRHVPAITIPGQNQRMPRRSS